MANSSFRGAPFDWEFVNPSDEIRSYIHVLSGRTVVYHLADLNALFSYFRPVNIRATGDPAVGGRVYVDHLGPDPSGPLQTYIQVSDPVTDVVTVQHRQFTAILSGIKRNQAQPGGVFMCDLEFTLLDAGVVI